MKRLVYVSLLCGLVGCGEDGSPGADGENGANTLVSVTTEGAGDNCASGGQRIDTGLDDGSPEGTAGDGVLQPGEIEQTTFICNGTGGDPGVSSLAAVSAEPAGDNCPQGGDRIDVGLDNGDGGGAAGNGVLEPGEVDTTFYACTGSPGMDGRDGADGTPGAPGSDGAGGVNTLVTVTPEEPGDRCAAGGQRIDTGLDDGQPEGTAGDGALQDGEVDATTYVCNGDAGTGGALVATRMEPPGLNCLGGGTRIDTGLDNGDGEGTAGNLMLEADEIDDTRFVCAWLGVGKYRVLPPTFNISFAAEACEARGLKLATWSGTDDLDDMLAACDIPVTTASQYCFAQYRATGGTAVSIHDGSPMPPIPDEYWQSLPIFSEGQSILARPTTGAFIENLSFAYPLCMVPGT